MPESDRPQTRPNSFRLPAAMALGVIWLAALLWVTLTTANPTTLNRFQVQNSDFILQGQFDAELKKFLIKKSWPEDASQDSIRFQNLDELSAKPETDYIVPVVNIEKRFYVTPTKLKGKPLIYPVNDESIHQLELLLGN